MNVEQIKVRLTGKLVKNSEYIRQKEIRTLTASFDLQILNILKRSKQFWENFYDFVDIQRKNVE